MPPASGSNVGVGPVVVDSAASVSALADGTCVKRQAKLMALVEPLPSSRVTKPTTSGVALILAVGFDVTAMSEVAKSGGTALFPLQPMTRTHTKILMAGRCYHDRPCGSCFW